MTAQIRVRDSGGTLRTVSRIRVRDADGALRTVQRVRVRDAGNTLRTVFEYFKASVSPTSISEIGSSTVITTSDTADVTVVGGAQPVTYAWTNIGGDNLFASSPFAASTTFKKAGAASGEDYAANFICTVTDAAGTALTTDPVEVQISRS